MLETTKISTEFSEHICKIFGNGKINMVIEMGLGATIGEWWHVAERLSSQNTVLLYERSRNTERARTPENIAEELNVLLDKLPHEEKITLIAHSQGGLYAQQFARLHPELMKGAVFIDPLSARDNEYKTLLTPKEQKKSGFDKSDNLAIMGMFAKFHLGFFIKAIMKNAPPFYYYPNFSDDAKNYIMSAIVKPDIYSAAVAEYRLAHEAINTEPLMTKDNFPEIPVVLLTHTEEFSIKETMEFGRVDQEFAEKVENIWQSLMNDYLSLSEKSKHITAKNSGHFIHLTEPELLTESIAWIEENA